MREIHSNLKGPDSETDSILSALVYAFLEMMTLIAPPLMKEDFIQMREGTAKIFSELQGTKDGIDLPGLKPFEVRTNTTSPERFSLVTVSDQA